MSIFSSYKKIFLFGFILVILIAIPFSVYLAQKRQQTKVGATKSSTLSFEPATTSVKVDNTLVLDVVLDPGSGASANQVSFVKLSINFDASKFTTISDSLVPNTAPPNTLTSILEDATYSGGKATISLSIGADPTKVVTSKTKIAIVKLKAIAPTTDSAPTNVTFDSATQVLSIASSDQTSENVLSTTNPSSVTITGLASATPTPAPTIVTPTSVPGFGGFTGSAVVGIAPVCSNLSVDNFTTGVAPYSLTFTAVGSDSDGTITKASFNFGDGPIQDVIAGGGIGTATTSSQLTHTFTTPGIYSVYAILTDNQGNLSNQTEACAQTVTINSNLAFVTPTLIPLDTKGGLPATGPEDLLGSLGAIGVIFTIIGGALLFLL